MKIEKTLWVLIILSLLALVVIQNFFLFFWQNGTLIAVIIATFAVSWWLRRDLLRAFLIDWVAFFVLYVTNGLIDGSLKTVWLGVVFMLISLVWSIVVNFTLLKFMAWQRHK